MHAADRLTLQAPKPTATFEDVRLPLPLADVERWFSTADSGSAIVYHRGFLALDRGAGSRLGEDAGEELDHVAAVVMAMADAGHVHLLQRRHGLGDYSYIAVAAGRGVRHGAGRSPRGGR